MIKIHDNERLIQYVEHVPSGLLFTTILHATDGPLDDSGKQQAVSTTHVPCTNEHAKDYILAMGPSAQEVGA